MKEKKNEASCARFLKGDKKHIYFFCKAIISLRYYHNKKMSYKYRLNMENNVIDY